MRRPVMLSLLVLATLNVLPGLAAGKPKTHPVKKAIVWSADEMKWSDNPALKGAKVSVLWGDPKKGAYGSLKTIPAGGSIPLHTHSHDTRVVLLSGVVTLSIDGGPGKDLGSGSYAYIPAGVKHLADCKAGADCEYLEQQPGASDIKFVGGSAVKP